MKSLVLMACMITGLSAYAATEEVSIERSRAEVPLTIELNKNTVRCLVGDYSSSSLKISVPDLKGYTLFPQTTRGETAPCINAGSCQFDKTPDGRKLDPSLILDPARPTEDVKISVVLNEVLTIDHDHKTCERELREHISSNVRGLLFQHEDGGYLGNLDYDICLSMQAKAPAPAPIK